MLDRTVIGCAVVALLVVLSLPSRAQDDEAPTSQPAASDDNLEELAEEHAGDSPEPTDAATTEPRQPVTAEVVTYAAGETPTVGYLARPEGLDGPAPGLVVIHEWWGLNDNIRAMTERLAGEGYVALAVDLYGGRVADNPDDAMALMQAANENAEATEANLRQAIAFVASNNGGQRIGVIGWCFGGGQALQATLANPAELAATVIYYGQLETDPSTLAVIESPVLGIFGAEDSFIPVETIRSFESALNELGKSVEIHVYEGADHAFANPSGQRYQADAAAQAWQQTVDFLAENLR